MSELRHEVIFAPAGSGKTERLTRRYIELLEAGVPPERILTLTFTEKAAAEMKERIFQRVSERDPELGKRLRLDALKLRISTIHSFCLTLIRRFAPSLDLDPRVDVLPDPSEIWTAAKYDALMAIAQSEQDNDALNLLLELVTKEERIGWEALSKLFDKFFGQRINIARGRVELVDRELLKRLTDDLRADPLTRRLTDTGVVFPTDFSPAAVRAAIETLQAQSELFLTQNGTPRRPRGKGKEAEKDWNERLWRYYSLLRADAYAAEFTRSFELFRQRFLAAYEAAKRDAGQVDYADMEYLALQLLERDPDWQNVLRAFDEHTDHLLVDEFQDTSYLQWGIIDKLTEEWRSGAGAKADRGVEPTIFLVGDDKQSIYLFRGAKVEVFSKAADKLEEWLGRDKVNRITLEDNYRSLQSIIDFNNRLFSSLMSPKADKAEPWQTRYTPFRRARSNDAPGAVEVIIAPGEGKAEERRETCARVIARRIRALVNPVNPFTVYNRSPDGTETARPCNYSDIGILFRSRQSLPALEDALRAAGIPFLVCGGTGFYQEPEVRYVIKLATALVDPFDSLALYATLRGPVFGIPERDIFLANSADAPSLLERCRVSAPPGSPLATAIATLDRWRALVPVRPLARILEAVLAEQKVWQTFWEPQRVANLRKLLELIENRAAAGETPLRIISALQKADADESKADVRPEGRNAVQLMTVHAAKGLQFPVVFYAGLDEVLKPLDKSAKSELVIEETGPEEVLVSWLPDANLRRQSDFHMTYVQKELEEEKRIFYVACTRARDGLFLVGALGDQKWKVEKTQLGWLVEHLKLVPAEFRFSPDLGIPGVSCVNADTIPDVPAPAQAAAKAPSRRVLRPAAVQPPPRVNAITRNVASDFKRHPDETIGIGDAVHHILELISLGKVTPADINAALSTVENHQPADTLPASLTPAIKDLTPEIVPVVLKHLKRLLADKSAWSIIAPRAGAETELPVMYSDGTTVWTGRIDRVIFEDDEVRIYDYKTFAVKEAELERVAQEYHDAQLFHYAAALRRIYPDRKISTWLVFTGLRPVRIVQTS